MWLIQQKVFDTHPDDIVESRSKPAEATAANHLTVIVGNGTSQSSSYLQSLCDGYKGNLNVGWKSAVMRAAEEMGIPENLRNTDQNLLALAQAVFEAYGPANQSKARQTLLKEIQ